VYSDYSVEVDSQKCYIPRRAGVTVQKNLDIALLWRHIQKHHSHGYGHCVWKKLCQYYFSI